MDDRRINSAAPLAAVALLVLLLTIYVSGFYLLGRVGTVGPTRFHVYKSRWLAQLYTPAAQVESWVLKREVYAAHTEQP